MSFFKKANQICLLLFIFFSTFSHVVLFSEQSTSGASNVVQLKPNEILPKQDNINFKIFCYNSIPKSILYLWRTVHLVFEKVPLSYEIFPGVNETEVEDKHAENSVWFKPSWFSGQQTYVDFPAFSNYCLGISTEENYAIQLQVRTINYWRLLQFIIGLLLFVSAPSLSRNPFFHYTSAISLGVLGSVLVILYVISRFIPKKTTSYALLFFGYSFILYIFQSIWKDISEIINRNLDIVVAYCLCAALISFVICYRFGPVENVRTFNIIQWSMQTLAAILIYLSSEYREVSTAIILIVIGLRQIPGKWIKAIQMLWYRYFPPKRALLSKEEYIHQGEVETKKALDELRKYCSSPECNAWKTISQLRDPIKFAGFIESGHHVSFEDSFAHAAVGYDCETDDESDAEESSFRGNGVLQSG
ncbi:hypothetical protein JTE90_028387 [Oedothorax gibbosus]|uniref:Nuclear envelope integral membrane protein 1 n=1 Tax=Oedothorax gibbosus TaxID=931172 RepID=A0AAV6VDQ0_9ARAC|nr:hypothetical protein JTE90_028387 [Oedothorax gibbosus]